MSPSRACSRFAAALALARLASAAAQTYAAAPTYDNPVLRADVPDPGAVFDASSRTYFAATTGGDGSSGLFPIHSSPDLGNSWASASSIFNASTLPKWSDRRTGWAPELHFVPSANGGAGGYVAYFVSRLGSTNALCVGAAASLTGSPAGPYADSGSPLVLSPPGSCFGVIDPTFWFDPATGTPYVIYKEDGNSCGKPTNIYAQALMPSGTAIDASRARTLLIGISQPWELTLVEAPWMMQKDNALLLFYSGAYYDKPSYAIGVARSASGSLDGPWEKYAGNPVLHSAPGAGQPGPEASLHYGPGHCSVLVVAEGTPKEEWVFLYAAMAPGGNSGRNLMLDAIAWTADGWPVGANGGVPSNKTQPLPGS